MTTEEKAKAYDEAIRKAKITLGCCDSASIITEHTIYDIFPELKESEDERIRKELITHCRNTRCVTEEGAERIAKWIAWLEKQEQKPIEIAWVPSEEQIKVLDKVLNFAANHESPYWNNYIFETLNNFIRQLKKLKGE